MFKKLECVSMYTSNLEESISFYESLGLKKKWTIERASEDGKPWYLIGLSFPEGGSELVLHNDSKINFTEIEIYVEDVVKTYEQLKSNDRITWIRDPFATESGHVAVMEGPDGNAFVLVGK